MPTGRPVDQTRRGQQEAPVRNAPLSRSKSTPRRHAPPTLRASRSLALAIFFLHFKRPRLSPLPPRFSLASRLTRPVDRAQHLKSEVDRHLSEATSVFFMRRDGERRVSTRRSGNRIVLPSRRLAQRPTNIAPIVPDGESDFRFG